jgi:hypothetical protein
MLRPRKRLRGWHIFLSTLAGELGFGSPDGRSQTLSWIGSVNFICRRTRACTLERRTSGSKAPPTSPTSSSALTRPASGVDLSGGPPKSKNPLQINDLQGVWVLVALHGGGAPQIPRAVPHSRNPPGRGTHSERELIGPPIVPDQGPRAELLCSLGQGLDQWAPQLAF